MPEPISLKYARLTLLLLGFVAYAPILRVGFLWDDHPLIEQNPHIRSWTWPNLHHDLASTVSNNQGDGGFLRPVVTWSNRMDYSLWRLNPFGYHLTTLALHLGNVLFLYELLLLLGSPPLAALLTAALFAVHPIGVEGLLCITGRATLLSFFFTLLSLLFLAEPTPPKVGAGMLSFALALGSKEQSVILPFLLALVWIVRKAPKRRYLLLAPLLILLGLYLMYRRHLFGVIGAPINLWFAIRFYLQAFPRILTNYIRVILVPWNLHSHRMIPHMSHFWMLSLAAWVGLLVWSAYRRLSYPWVFFCVYWFVLGLLPPSVAMVYGGFILDHWGYWLAPAVLFPIGLLTTSSWAKRGRSRYPLLAMLIFPLLIGYALVTRLNIELRNTDEKMYRWALNFTASHPIKFNLGLLLYETGREKEAIVYFEDVRRAYPEDLNNLHALALAYWKSGHPGLALDTLQVLLKQDPSYAPALQSLHVMKARLSATPSLQR